MICTDPDCNLLFVRRPHKSAKCPGCATMAGMLLAPRKSRKWPWVAALLLVLIGGALAWYFLYNPLSVTPKQWRGRAGDRTDFHVTKSFLFWERDVSDEAFAASYDRRVIRIDPPGLRATAVHPGEALVHFYYGRHSVSAAVTVERPRRLYIDPPKIELEVGATAPLKLLGIYDDGDERDLTRDAAWTTNREAVAMATGGIVEGVAAGEATVEADYDAGMKNGLASASVHVVGPRVAAEPKPVSEPSVSGPTRPGSETPPPAPATTGETPVPPAVPSPSSVLYVEPRYLRLQVGEVGILKVSAPAGPAVQLLSSDPAVAETDEGFRVIGRSPGQAKVDVRQEHRVMTVDVSVTAAGIESRHGKPSHVAILSDQGSPVRFPVGSEFGDFRVEAKYADGFTRLVTKKATLLSSDPPGQGPASFADGRMLGVRPGKTTVQAEFEGTRSQNGLQVEVTADVDVDEIRLTPTPVSILRGETVALDAIGYKSGKPVGSITGRGDLVWKSSDEKTARVDGPAVTGAEPGMAQVTAQLDAVVSRPAQVLVRKSIPEALMPDLGRVRLWVGQRCLIGTDLTIFQGGADVSRQVHVSPDKPGVVGYDSDLHALVALAPGESQVTFSRGDKRAVATVEVVDAPLPEGQVVVEPAAAALWPGQRQPLRVFLVTEDGKRIDRTGAATLTSSDPKTVRISANRAHALAPGTAEIAAALPEASTPGRAFITVDARRRPGPIRPTPEPPPRFTGLRIDPDRVPLKVGDWTPPFSVTVEPEGGTRIEVPAVLESLNPRVLAPDAQNPGRFTAKAPGRTRVRAVYGGQAVSAEVTVASPWFARFAGDLRIVDDQGPSFRIRAVVVAQNVKGTLEYRVCVPGQNAAQLGEGATGQRSGAGGTDERPGGEAPGRGHVRIAVRGPRPERRAGSAIPLHVPVGDDAQAGFRALGNVGYALA